MKNTVISLYAKSWSIIQNIGEGDVKILGCIKILEQGDSESWDTDVCDTFALSNHCVINQVSEAAIIRLLKIVVVGRRMGNVREGVPQRDTWRSRGCGAMVESAGVYVTCTRNTPCFGFRQH
ncbi:hypothetical protein BDN70DRAFT_871878 [Pholiota conissans]|uniref:Uncharacterized protein n=1 Tax=Pholiota conissans TaxID=109636 RepID=A0A9P6D6Q2_9AGAR|nr:hypothetical protein BDN70DRAFT_871878 [Pholiota conissans]